MSERRDIGQGDRVYVSTYGCQMNEHDTERMYSLLEMHNFVSTPTPENADVIIINSCSVREKPVHKVLSEVGTYKVLKSKNPKLRIGVGGCVGNQEGEKLLKDVPTLDFVFGTDTIDKLPDIVEEVRSGFKTKVVNTRFEHRAPYEIETLVRHTRPTAFVSITKGCDNFCAFCVVPFTRGREKSRLMSEILYDVKNLVQRGVREVTLLGQNVNSYESPDGKGGLSALLRLLCEETEILRVRYTTSHPKDFDDELIQTMAEYRTRLCDYIHLPVQSGSSRVLERMNRGYTREQYLEKIKKIKTAIPGVVLSSDFIVGFPGETEEDFQDTLRMLEEVRYDSVFAFKYSPRPFTKAAKFDDQIPEDLKQDRFIRFMDLQDRISYEICQKYENRVFDVLVEGPSRENPHVLSGRTRQNRLVNFPGEPGLIGKIIPVRVVKAFPNTLRGELISDAVNMYEIIRFQTEGLLSSIEGAVS